MYCIIECNAMVVEYLRSLFADICLLYIVS